MQNGIDLSDYKLLVPGGTGKLGKTLINGVKSVFGEVIVGNRSGENSECKAYEIGKLDRSELSGNTLAVIATTAEGVEKSLEELENFPTIITSSNYDVEEVLKKYADRHILIAPNLSPTIFDLVNIFKSHRSFTGIEVHFRESHQSGKIDYSGTVKDIGIFLQKLGGVFEVDTERYNADTGVSELGSVTTYRGEASRDYFDVPTEYMEGHAYHEYHVTLDFTGISENMKEEAMQKFNILRFRIEEWFRRNKENNSQDIYVSFDGERQQKIIFGHNVNGRGEYIRGLLEVAPWFLSQEKGHFDMGDFVSYKKTLGQTS